MKDIRIAKLTLDNFKGCHHFELTPDGRDCSIYGNNATGKSTLYDALTWLLFGKDSTGQTNFEIKPLGRDGQILDHTTITTVEAVLTADYDEVTLKKCYYEKWSTKRGSATETFDGNTSDYYIDGVPVKKYEFEEQVSQLVDEDLFRILTGVTWFCAGMDWRSRRTALFELGQVAADSEIMAEKADFLPLAQAMGKLTLDEYKKKVQAERKGYTGIRNDLPVRLDECKKAVEEIAGTDFATLRRERDERIEKRDALSADLVRLDNDSFLSGRRNDRDRLKNELTALEQENTAHRRAQEQPAHDVGTMERELSLLEKSLLNTTEERRRALERVQQNDAEVERCRDAWKAVNARRFGKADCPVCRRPLEGELLSEAQERFELEKRTELDDLVRDSNSLKAQAASARKYADECADAAVETENKIARLKDELRAAAEAQAVKVDDLPGYETKRNGFLTKIADLDSLIQRHTADSAAIRAETRERIGMLNEEITAIEGALAREVVLATTQERMDKLREEATAAAAMLEKLDGMLVLCEAFTRYKTQRIEESINSRFSLVRWKLFAEQVNGGLAECCEATVDGVPYNSLNSGMRINAGIDVIKAVSSHYGVRVPLVVDNAETVTALQPLDGQLIRLVVSEADKELRCEYGT